MTKRFILFAGDHYYPEGGADDVVDSFDSIENAIAAHDRNRYQYDGGWANILDAERLCVCARFSSGTWLLIT